ncbi:MAG: aspartate dehydrogenase [Clostridiales bacterium]|nr:aspartate dehydrogenase [Clostridiales bacterium]
MFFGKKKTARPDLKKDTFDPAIYKPVLKCSICNGEQVAGFKNLQTGKFEEVMYIRQESELKDFLEKYGLERIEKEY